MKLFTMTMILKKEKLIKFENCAVGGISKFKTVKFCIFLTKNFTKNIFLVKNDLNRQEPSMLWRGVYAGLQCARNLSVYAVLSVVKI